ncbi:MAG: molybdopterin-dependent oxidoreductase, partial [Firmicutes bacterium]|nr:molybdopterin-dependent oxidoreductase [Bacillota bacterium]
MKTCKAICPNDCPCACGLLLTIEGNEIIKIQGDPEHPLFDGGICSKMRKNYLSLYDEKRITSPLKRIGRKGEGKFKKISWEEAIEEITSHWKNNLEQYGPNSIVGISSSGTMGLLQKNIVDALFHKMGARQVEMTLCSGAKQAAYKSMTEGKGAMCPSLLKESDYVLVWSCMLEATQFQSLGVLRNLRKEGKKVVCIDVFTKENEKYCDESILIKPGSDGALAMAMMHVLVKEGYSDEEYLKSHTIGYEDFKKSLDAYTPAWAEEKTGISQEVIVRLAREFGQVKKPAILLGSGFSRRKNGGMNSRLIMILSAITGAWKYPGGGYVGRKSRNGDCIDMNQICRPDLRTYSGKKENINTLSLTFQDPSLHAFYCAGFNPVNSIHNQLGTIAGLSREDLFTVVHERVMTDTAKYADIILPATYSYEHSDCHNANLYNTFGVSYQAVIPQKESKSNWDTIGLLAR